MTATLVMTRRADDAIAFADAVRDATCQDVRFIVSPAFEVEFDSTVDVEGDARCVFTSRNGVDAAVMLGINPAPAWCVGQATASRARDAGFTPLGEGGDVERLFEQITTAGASLPLLHVRGAHSRGDLATRLSAAGIPCQEAIAYRQRRCAPTAELRAALEGSSPLVFPFFSPRSTLILKDETANAPLFAVAMSVAVANALSGPRFQEVRVSEHPTQNAMVDATILVLNALEIRGA